MCNSFIKILLFILFFSPVFPDEDRFEEVNYLVNASFGLLPPPNLCRVGLKEWNRLNDKIKADETLIRNIETAHVSHSINPRTGRCKFKCESKLQSLHSQIHHYQIARDNIKCSESKKFIANIDGGYINKFTDCTGKTHTKGKKHCPEDKDLAIYLGPFLKEHKEGEIPCKDSFNEWTRIWTFDTYYCEWYVKICGIHNASYNY